MSELAQWQSHKIVRAGKLMAQQVEHDDSTDHSILTVEDVNGVPCKVAVPTNFFARGAPVPGDYVVIYDDGYKSWSPVKAFEEGYTKL
jgi:hypothetical protein